jgi:HEAT repeat protein
MNKNLLFLVVGCVALAAQTVKITNGEGPPVLESGERILQEKYHIAPTEEGLLGALQHRESEVRKLAAGTLAANGDKAAIRPILAALAAETVESNKIFLATAAAELGSAEGFNALKGMCDDRNWSPVQRMIAAQTMDQMLGRQECLSDILEVLWLPADNRYADSMALTLLSQLKQIPPSRLDEIRNLSAVYSKSQASELRMAASHLIRVLGGPWAVSQLQAGQDAEQDENVRSYIAKELSSLRQ